MSHPCTVDESAGLAAELATETAGGAVSPATETADRGSYDPARRRRGVRKGREMGCWVYIPAAELREAGLQPGGELPFYRVWGRGRGSVLVRLYREG